MTDPRYAAGARPLLGRRAVVAGALGLAALGPASARGQAADSDEPWAVVSARGDGDYADLEQAVREAPSNSTLLVRSGTYEISDGRISPPPGLRITGEGVGTHLRARAGLATDLFRISAPHVVLESLLLDGNAAEQASGSTVCCVRITATGVQVVECTLTGATSDALLVDSPASACTVRGNRIPADPAGRLRNAVSLRGASDCVVTGNTIARPVRAGITAWSGGGECAGHAIAGNAIRGAGAVGILVEDGARDTNVGGNTCFGGGAGIRVTSSGTSGSPSLLSISGNTCGQNAGEGIGVRRGHEVTVSGNVLRGNGGHGLYASGCRNLAVSGNVFEQNGLHGALLDQPAGVLCTGNVARGNGRLAPSGTTPAGIALVRPSGSSSAASLIAHNRCHNRAEGGPQRVGVALRGARPGDVVSSNLVSGNAGSGLVSTEPARDPSSAAPHRRLQATVGAVRTAIPHGLPHPPRTVVLALRSPGQAWVSAPADQVNVYLTADGASRAVELVVG